MEDLDFSQMSQAQLKKLYPNLPEWFFFTPKRKRKYFNNLNSIYADKITKEKRIL